MKVKITDYKNSGKQNISIRIDSWDIYNADITLARVILATLKAYKKKSTGCPGEFLTNASNPATDEEEAKAFKEWNQTLNRMILAFKLIIEDVNDDKNYAKIREGLDLFAKYFTHLWL